MPDSPLRERLHRAIQDADTGMPSWPLRPAYAPLADAALSTLTLADHIAAVEASGTHVVVDQRAVAPADGEIIRAWKDAGGNFYGPHVEHADMEYAKWLPFMRRMLAARPRDTE